MKRNRRGHPKGFHQSSLGGTSRKEASDIDESSPIIQSFREFQKQLDARHDKHERIVKLSRDITIESKRIIFQLHRISGEENKGQLLEESDSKLKELEKSKWKNVADELYKEDPYQFLRAYSGGLQEYIESLSLYHYLKDGSLITLEEVEERLRFVSDEPAKTPSQAIDQLHLSGTEEHPLDLSTTDHEAASSTSSSPQQQLSVHIPPNEYILGIADLTGELMRMAIGSVGTGQLDKPFELCKFMRLIHDAFVSFGKVSRELTRKLHVLKQSLQKVETACYTLQVRGQEIPKHMLADIFSSTSTQQSDFDVQDEGVNC